MTDFSNAYENGLTWQEIMAELDGIDDIVEKNLFIKRLGLAKDEWNECSKHQIKHHGVAGGCPLCLLRTFFEEKQRIGDIGYVPEFER